MLGGAQLGSSLFDGPASVQVPLGAMTRREFLQFGAAFGGLTLAGVAMVGCGTPTGVRKGPAKVGFLGGGNPGAPAAKQSFEALVVALKSLGYAEGQNIAFEPRFLES